MPSIVNRSNYLVTVEGKPERIRKFPFNKLKDAKRYEREQQKAQTKEGHEPESVQLKQLEDTLLVRIRAKGYPTHRLQQSANGNARPALRPLHRRSVSAAQRETNRDLQAELFSRRHRL